MSSVWLFHTTRKCANISKNDLDMSFSIYRAAKFAPTTPCQHLGLTRGSGGWCWPLIGQWAVRPASDWSVPASLVSSAGVTGERWHGNNSYSVSGRPRAGEHNRRSNYENFNFYTPVNLCSQLNRNNTQTRTMTFLADKREIQRTLKTDLTLQWKVIPWQLILLSKHAEVGVLPPCRHPCAVWANRLISLFLVSVFFFCYSGNGKGRDRALSL